MKNKTEEELYNCIERFEIEEYCAQNGIEPRIDRTNFENVYTRNKVRNIVIPFIKKELMKVHGAVITPELTGSDQSTEDRVGKYLINDFIELYNRLDEIIERSVFMIRGTTTQFIFKLPNEVVISDITYVMVTFWQKGNKGTSLAPLPIIKHFSNNENGELSISSPDDPHKLIVVLTSEETARFTDKLKARVQLKVVANGVVYGTYQSAITIYPMHDGMAGGDVDSEVPTGDGWIVLDGDQIVE
mgnify:CR=1 FL=1